jgi:hypothetical protein
LVKDVTPLDDSEEGLRDWIKKTVSTTWHPCGSASMLPREHGGVVDSELKVYGTVNLRVVCQVVSSRTASLADLAVSGRPFYSSHRKSALVLL